MYNFRLHREIFSPRSLHQRTVLFLLVPIFVFLTLAGVVGYRAMRTLLLTQWSEIALARLEQAAHQIDMELQHPQQILSLLDGMSETEWRTGMDRVILTHLRGIEGVVGVKVIRPEGEAVPRTMMGRCRLAGRFEIAAPLYNVEHGSRTVSMSIALLDRQGKRSGCIEVVLDFEILISKITRADWRKLYKAYIVDRQGTILVSTQNGQSRPPRVENDSFAELGPLERKTLAMMAEKTSGTVFGPGRPPVEISGFYRLKEAPWTLVVIAPGKKVLQPIIHFRNIFFPASFLCILFLLLFIRVMVHRTTRTIQKVSETAGNLAQGVFSEPLQVSGRDEIAELVRNFNTMTSRLREGIRLQEAMDIAREVQATLLPDKGYNGNGLQVSGLSIYCDETGGDYYDFIESEHDAGELHVVVGDVVGHGIGAALLMATLRALVRAHVKLLQEPGELISRINRLLCLDTADLGNFASLFYLRIDMNTRRLHWVRAGHDPAMLFFPATGEFMELKGRGLVLGLNPDYGYQAESCSLAETPCLLLIGSDGAWEARNEAGEQFGKERLRECLREKFSVPPAELLDDIVERIEQFRGREPLADDITLVAVQINGVESSSKGEIIQT